MKNGACGRRFCWTLANPIGVVCDTSDTHHPNRWQRQSLPLICIKFVSGRLP